MSTMTMQHRWVKHTITNVTTISDPTDDTQIVVLESDEANKEAEDNAVYGCDECGVPMAGNSETECDPMCHCGANFSEHGSFNNHSPVAMR